MKILHIIIDGYSPDNEDLVFDWDQINLSKSKIVTYGSHSDGKDLLKSARQWFRYYSKFIVKNNKGNITSHYTDCPGEKLLWRVLADKGIPSFIMPFNTLTEKSSDWLIGTGESRKLISGIFKKWYDTKCWILDEGEWIQKNTDYIAPAMMPNVKGDGELDDPEFVNKMNDLNSSETNSEYAEKFEKYKSDIARQSLSMMESRISDIWKNYDNELKPLLEKFLSKNSSGYFHIGVGESDSVYHFRKYQSNMKLYRDFLNEYLQDLIITINPDLVVICGDHNMIPVNDHPYFSKRIYDHSRKKIAQVELDGNKTYISTSNTANIPIFNDHGFHVMGDFCYRNLSQEQVNHLESSMKDLSNQNDKPYDEPMLPEFLYDYFTNLDTWRI